MSKDESEKRALEYASRMCIFKNEGVHIVYDSDKTDKTVKEFYSESGIEYNYVYFEWKDYYYCFETYGCESSEIDPTFFKDFSNCIRCLDVSAYKNDGMYFILRGDTNRIIFNVYEKYHTPEPVRLEITPSRIILLRSFPIKDNMIDFDKYFKGRIVYHNGRTFPINESLKGEECLCILALRKGSETYILGLDFPATHDHLNEIIGEKEKERFEYNIRNHRLKLYKDYSIGMGEYELILKGKQVTYLRYPDVVLATVDYDDVKVFYIKDTTLYCRTNTYRYLSEIEQLCNDAMLKSDIRLYKSDFEFDQKIQFDRNFQFDFPDVACTFFYYIDELEEGITKDKIMSYDNYKEKRDFNINDLLEYYGDIQGMAYGFDNDMISVDYEHTLF